MATTLTLTPNHPHPAISILMIITTITTFSPSRKN
jgi:hypothetical protein